MNECIFCRIINSEIPDSRVYEDDNHIAFLDIHPLRPGHILVVPKQHTDDIFDMPSNEYVELHQLTKKLGTLMKRAQLSKRIGIVVEGFGVPHVHIHLVPINSPHDLNPDNAYTATNDELVHMQKLLKDIFDLR